MWSEQETPTLDELVEILKLRDKDWLSETLRQRYHKLQVSFEAPSRTIQRPIKSKRASTDEGILDESLGEHDITAPFLPPSTLISDHVAMVRNFNWASTELGPMSSWIPQLRRILNFIMADPRAAVVWWGDSRYCIYNEPYAQFLGEKHPAALGRPAFDVWTGDASKELQKAFFKADTLGQSSKGDRSEFFAERNGHLEELYGDWAIIPIAGGENNHGYYNSVMELTHQVQHQRQLDTLLRLERQTGDAKDLNEFWPSIIEVLQPNPQDVPFAAVYSALPRSQSSRSSSVHSFVLADPDSVLSSRFWSLEGTLGVSTSTNSPAFPTQIDSEWATLNFTSAFKDCVATGKVQLIHLKPGTALYNAAESRAYRDQCKLAALCPIGKAQDGEQIGFLLLGINSRRPYDLVYKQFVRLLARQLVSSLTAVRNAEDDARKANMAAELAALDRVLLSEKLAMTAQEAKDNERRFRSIAAHIPIAMYEILPSGEMIFANDSYYELTGMDRTSDLPFNWLDSVHEADMHIFEGEWNRLAAGESVRFEARLRKPFVAGDVLNGETVQGETWVLSAAFAHKTADGTVESIQGAVLDISRQKWMETSQERRLAEAIELKRQQENFMDFVGHEIRNPLSATSLCASSILSSLEDLLLDDQEPLTVNRETIQREIDNAEIITTCIQHQKRIIDDVLTLSKLDTGLLNISPCEIKPTDLVAQSLKLFEAEIQQADSHMNLVVDQSYRRLAIEWAMVDPSRLLQILINLVTNAIRFTKNEDTRSITVTIAACNERPSCSLTGTTYLSQPNGNPGADNTMEVDDNVVYLMFAIEDTGCGMRPHELERIFQRFQQSSHKTHIEYGGSGLGLFISRELARLQGGQIGVASEHGVGSKFEFYIKAARCAPPRKSSAAEGFGPSLTTIRSRSGPVTQSAQTRHAGKPQYFLLVEDNRVNQRVMQKQLQQAGYQVTLANHGVEALEHISQSRYCAASGVALDVVLMDIEMPVMGGLECTQRIRSMQATGDIEVHVPIVAITANARGEQQTAALDAGVDTVVTKPFNMKELLAEVDRIFTMSAS